MSIDANEMRGIVLDLLKASPWKHSYEEFVRNVAQAIVRKYSRSEPRYMHDKDFYVDGERELFRDVFWDLFREGIITPYAVGANASFLEFRVSSFALDKFEREGDESAYFRGADHYVEIIKGQIPNIDEVTLVYLLEAMKAYQSGCMLSSTVMLGVATEHSFELLMEDIGKNREYASIFDRAIRHTNISQKIREFKDIMEPLMLANKKKFEEIIDNFGVDFLGIINMIRNFRNESGHPSGQIISRHQVFVLLQLFPVCGKKIYQLRSYFQKT